jgi:hypothetical protein
MGNPRKKINNNKRKANNVTYPYKDDVDWLYMLMVRVIILTIMTVICCKYAWFLYMHNGEDIW